MTSSGKSVAGSVPSEVARRLHRRLAGWLEGLAGDDERLLLGRRCSIGAAARRQRSTWPCEWRGPRACDSSARTGLPASAAAAEPVDPADIATRELQQHVAALAAELGQHELALARWSSLTFGPGERVESARAALAASQSALHLGRAPEAWQWLARAREDGAVSPHSGSNSDAQESALHRHLEHRAEASRAAARRAVDAARVAAARVERVETMDGPERHAYVRGLLAGTEAALEAGDLEEMLALSEELAMAAAQVDDRIRARALGGGALALRLLGRNQEAEVRARAGLGRDAPARSRLRPGWRLGPPTRWCCDPSAGWRRPRRWWTNAWSWDSGWRSSARPEPTTSWSNTWSRCPSVTGMLP